MQTYVAEIKGRGIIAFRAANEVEAQSWLDNERTLRSDLAVLKSEGQPLWDGETTILVRAATIPEQVVWRRKSVELTEEDDGHHPRSHACLSGPHHAPGPICRLAGRPASRVLNMCLGEQYERSKNTVEAVLESWQKSFGVAGQGVVALNRKIIDIADRWA